ncbi:MAG TPA: sulfotransferase [Parafilimonas sp.]
MVPILIVGMARSGTTLVSHIIGSLPDVHIEVEPHALWKSGNFKYFNDEEYDITSTIVNNLRNKFLKNIGDKIFVEKSPVNCLRPQLVHAVFPEAKILYIERDPIRCIYSNYKRSLKNDSFKLSIAVKKYFIYAGSKDLPGAISNRKIFQQVTFSDLPEVLLYSIKMLYLRQFNTLPFGPKLKHFMQIVKDKGLLGYHVEVYQRALSYRQNFIELYGDNLEVFSMENIMADPNEIKRMIEFIEMPYSLQWLQRIRNTFDEERVARSNITNAIDKQIEELLINAY